MFKLVLYDYINNLKLGYRKKSIEVHTVLILFIYNIFSDGVLNNFVAITLPILIGSFITGLNKEQINKMFYLCPIDLRERKIYFYEKMAINFTITMILFFILGFILLFNKSISLKFFIFNLVITISFIIYRNLSIIGYEYNYNKFKWCEVFEIALIVITIVNLIISLYWSLDGVIPFKNNIFVSLLVIQICISLCFLKYWKQIVEFIADYENYSL